MCIAMVAAFRILGYTTYDFVDRLLLEHMPLWTEAMVAKFKGKGQPWAREEFDKVFKGFDVRPFSSLQSQLVTKNPVRRRYALHPLCRGARRSLPQRRLCPKQAQPRYLARLHDQHHLPCQSVGLLAASCEVGPWPCWDVVRACHSYLGGLQRRRLRGSV